MVKLALLSEKIQKPEASLAANGTFPYGDFATIE
jgi:hypothetical protein